MTLPKNNIFETETIGLFFGTFNPIHIGHLIISENMLANGKLDRIWFVVTPRNPFKKNKSLLHQFDRYDLVRAAIADNYKLEVSDIEFNMPQPNYTVRTLAVLAEKFPNKKFALILGEDNLNNFYRWQNSALILNKYEIYVYPRPEISCRQKEYHHNIKRIDAPVLGISATYIRNAIQHKRSIRYLVPESVEHIIRTKGFYLS